MSLKYPIFVISGVTGTGKTTVAPKLRELLPGWNIFDKDAILCDSKETFEAVKPYAHCIWLRIAQEVAGSHIPLLICGAFSDQEFHPCRTYADFDVRWVHLHCEEANLRSRLTQRGVPSEEHNAILRDASERFIEHTKRGSLIISVGSISPAELAEQIHDWVKPVWETYCGERKP